MSIKNSKIKIFFIFLFMCFFTALFYPLYFSASEIVGSIYGYGLNDSARIDIFNYGSQSNNSVKILSDTIHKVPKWCRNESGSCVATINPLSSAWREQVIKFQVVGDGEITIALKGSDKYENYPIKIEYKDFYINEEKIFDEPSLYWNKKAFKYEFTARDGEVIEIKIKNKRPALFKTLPKPDVILFLTVLFCSVLLAYKLIFYVADFSNIEKLSCSDIVLLCLFFGLLFVPMSYISPQKKSKMENRMLADYPKLIVDGNFNLQYPKEFEEWFNDRFFGRNFLLGLYKNIMFNLNKYYRLNGFGLYKDNWAFNNSQIYSTLSDKHLQKVQEGIKAYKDFCEANKIKCYIEVVPRKLEFAKEKQLRIVPKSENDKAKIIAEEVFKQNGFNIIYPLKAMKKANKTDLVYFKTDHHWSDYGAFVGYQELMKEIKKDFPDLVILTEDDFDVFYSNEVRAEVNHEFLIGFTCKMLLLSDKECPKDVDYRYYTHKKEKELSIKEYDQKDKDFYAPYAPNKQKVVLLGNSFEENISYFLASSFQNVLKRRCNEKDGDNLNLSRWKEEIIKQNADIVVLVLHSEYSYHLQDLKD